MHTHGYGPSLPIEPPSMGGELAALPPVHIKHFKETYYLSAHTPSLFFHSYAQTRTG